MFYFSSSLAMDLKVVQFVVCLLSVFSGIIPVLALQKGDPCITPNGETSTCKLVKECKVIRDALKRKDPEAVIFAQKANEDCGFSNDDPMVCCGNYATLVVGETCTTPNGETATCVIPATCMVLVDALKSGNPNATNFAEKSLCSGKKAPLACCGSEAYLLGTSLLPNRTVCGQQKSDDRIYGGTITKLNEFPWTALLLYVDINGDPATDFRCGGSLINERYILTAAHCIKVRIPGVKIDTVRLAEWKISTERDCEEGVPNPKCSFAVDFKIEEEIVHDAYDRYHGRNDIGLLRLANNVIYSEYIRPICLPVRESPEPVPDTEMVVVGWGQTEEYTQSDYKMKAMVPIVSWDFCKQKVTHRGGPSPGHICAGKGKNDSCYGDSGGPLMQKVSRNLYALPRWYQEGVVSWGVSCAIVDSPAVYTRVALYMDWIIENLKPF